ncbi:MAG TPA: SRPBCC domain-containing protein [Actinomycetota bacterium]
MPDIHLTTQPIQADPERIYQAIATRDGLKAFWTDQVDGQSEVGSTLKFGFGPNREAFFDMRVERLDEPKLVEWTCVGGPPDWIGTKVQWEVEPADGGNKVKFHHQGWKSAEGGTPDITFVWAMVLDRLSQYAQSGKANPYFVR